ncbi:MAG: FAD-dependent oxidoreductase, partial [Actinobacteria bacterium]
MRAAHPVIRRSRVWPGTHGGTHRLLSRQRSYWLREALADDPGEPCPPLAGDASADVLIVGGGYTGMWTAHFIKERDPGATVVLVEQDTCGGGPSGRNGGFVNDLWEEIETLIDAVGEQPAVATCEISERSVQEIGAWCKAHRVDAWFDQVPHIGVSASSGQDGAWLEWLRTMERLGCSAGRLRELTPPDVQRLCRSPVFRGGILVERAATVQPARLARGLRRVILEQGVRVYERTPVRRFRGGRSVEAETPGGRIRAGQAVLGVNAWASQWRQFRRLILPRASYIVLTAPAPRRLEEIGWTGGQGIYDFRTSLHYLRTTPDGRIAFGGASSRAGLGTGMGRRLHYDPASVEKLTGDLGRMFPEFADVGIDAAWGGPIDVSPLHVPFFGTLPSGTVHYGLGYTGGGVGPCHLGGKILSGMVTRADDEYTRLPLVGLEPKPFPPEPLLSIGALLTHEAIVRRDDAQDRELLPNPLID